MITKLIVDKKIAENSLNESISKGKLLLNKSMGIETNEDYQRIKDEYTKWIHRNSLIKNKLFEHDGKLEPASCFILAYPSFTQLVNELISDIKKDIISLENLSENIDLYEF